MKYLQYFLVLILITILIIGLKLCKETFYSNFKLGIQTVFILKENIPFLEEWILYHKKIGFDKFYLYDNTGSEYIENNNGKNKRNINYGKLVHLNDTQLEYELNKLLKKYASEIIYVKWQPLDKNNKITYGQDLAIKHYIENYGSQCEWTAFTDLDEFIYVNTKKNIKQFITDKKVDKLILQQYKMNDRFCGMKNNKNVLSISDTLKINRQWAPKNIIKNKSIDLHSKISIHNIPIKSNKEYNCSKEELYFFHYNINNKAINFMKNFLKKDKFESIKNTTMKDSNNNLSGKINTKFINNKYLNEIYKDICYNY